MDTFNGVAVYFNGPMNASSGRNIAADGYNLGLRYQCVEFIKRYYYQRFQHRMPNASGHAKQYFDARVTHGALNPSRGLLQFRNGAQDRPQLEDVLVFDARPGNPYGHMAIVSAVDEDSLEFIQQNPGKSGRSRIELLVRSNAAGINVDHPRVLGWLRLPGRKPDAQMVAPAPVPAAVPIAPEAIVPSPVPEETPPEPTPESVSAPENGG